MHSLLAQNGYTQDYATFEKAFVGNSNYSNRKRVYDLFTQNGADIGKSYEDFMRRIQAKPQQKAKPVAQQKPMTMKQRAQEVAAQYQQTKPLKQPKYQQVKPLAQTKPQQPSTATASGTDYMQKWRLAHMRNDQMNPMQQAQASNMRARMQRAQEQAARQEQQRATPISRSRITPTAKNFNETMQQLSTPEARQARAKQQREDDARTFAQYEVEGNKFVRNDGQSEGILGNDLLELVDSSMNEAQELTRQQYQQNLDKMGGIYAPQSVKEQAFRDAQTQEQVNRQNVLMNNLSSKINEIYSQKGMQRHIAESAEKLNMSVEEYVDKYVTPEIINYAQKALTMRNQEEIMPHGALDYIAKNLSNSIIGMVLAPSVMSRDTRQRLQEGIAIADGDAEIQKVAGHKDETYRSGIGTRFASTAVNMAADSGPLAVIGAGASAAVNTGTRVLTNGLVKAGVMKAAQKLTAQQMAFKVANMTTAQKIMSGLGTRTTTSSLNLAGYSGVTAALSQASTGDDTSLQAIAEAGLKGAGHGAVTGAMFGVSGAVMSPWVSKFGITGMEKSTGERLLHGTQKFGATAAGLGVEAGTMMVADNVTGDKDISFGTWLEDVVMVGAFKAGEPSNFVKMGNILHHLTHNSGGNFVIGKNANGSPIAVDIRLTPDEKNELISSASGKNLMDAFVKVDRASKTAPRDPKYKTAYTDFMNDTDVSQSTKEKVNAAMGLFNTTRGKSYRSVNDVKNKQILEYTKNGTLLTRTSYKNADDRRAILYKQKLYRDNDDMMSLIGYSKMKDMQLTDEDGNVTSLALGFLRDNGYDTNKDVTDPKNAQLINDLRNPKSALYLDWEKYVDKNGSYGYLKSGTSQVVGGFMNSLKEIFNDKGQMIVDIDKIMQKDPMKRTDEENKIFYGVKRALEDELFPSGRPHEDQSASQGKAAAEDNNLGTEQPNGEVVLDELRNLRNAEQALDAAMEGNDVFKQVFEKLHQQGLTPAQIYDALIQNGLTQEELTPLAQYINANARVQGMQQATADAIEENVKEFTSDWSYHGTLNGQKMDGEQALYVQDSNSRTLLVGSGDVSFDQTTGKAKEGSGDMLVCLDPNTKELVYVKADEVTLFQNQPIDQFKAEYRQRLQMKNSEPYNQAAQEQAMQDAAKAQQEQQAPQDNTTNEENNTASGENITASGENNTKTEEFVPQEQPQPTRKFADGSDVPMTTDSKGRPTPDHASMTPEQAVAKSKTLTSDEIGAIVAEIYGNGSLDAFFKNSKAINDLIKTLVNKGIIGQNEVAQMMESPERLSAQGREFVKNLLLGSIFKPETIRMLGIDSTVKNKAINAIRSVMDNMKLGEFSLRDEIDQAIQLLYEARQGGNKVDTLLRTSDMYGEDAAKRYSSISQMMALALEGKVSDFRDLLDEYNRIAAARNTGEGSIFEAAPTKEELVKEFLDFKKWQDYGTGHSENEGGNDVSGDEKPQQEASGGNEPAEAERPRVEEPDDLVNKELEKRITETDEEFEIEGENGTIYKKKYLIDGDKEVMKVDEPNKDGDYTGSYYEFDGKKYGDLNEVVEHIDGKNDEGGLPLLPNEEKPDPKFNPIEAAAAEFKKEHPLTEEEIMKADVDDVVKDMALDYLNGDVTDDLHRAIYESIFAKTREQKTEPKVETPKAEPSADPMEGIKNAAEGFEKEKKAKVETEKKPQQTADDAAVAASNKKVNDLWDMLKNAGNDELSASFIGLNSKQLELLPKLVGAMAENAYLRIKRGMHNLEDVVKEMRKEFAPAAKVFKKEDVDAIYEQMMNIRYRDGEQRMSLKEWADYYEKTSPKHQENLVGDSKSAEQRKQAEKKFIDAVKLQLSFGRKFKSIVELRKMAERLGLKDVKDTDLQELAETANVQRARSIAASEATDNAGKFKRIVNLYENQPSLNQGDSERVMKQQYSTPAPYAFLADMYVKGNGKVIESALEPSAGNGMLTIGLPMDKVHVNDIDAQRLANLRRQGFKNVTSQDGTQPFADKDVDVVVTNPPFGSATPKEYDGYKISSLEGQMAINALESMKDDGRAAIIIGGKTEYAKNGSLNPKDKAFLGYLYSHYNVEDVINVDGSLYVKQGTTYPTRIILINGRRKYDPEHKVFPPVEKDARAETVKDYDELYKRIEDDILRERGVQKEPLGLSNRERVSDVSGDSLRQKERGGNGVTNNKEHGSGPDGVISDLGTGGGDERPMGETERTPSEHMGDNTELEGGRDSDSGADRGTGTASSRLDNGGRVPEGSVAGDANETSNESRKDGYIVTGNLMQALVDSKDQGLGGQLVKYTTDTGEVKTGILMPDRFDPKGLTTDAPINSVAEKFELSSWHGGIDEVTSSDGEVKVKRMDNHRGNYYEIRVPKSKAKGGKYFTDKELLDMVDGHNFETRGNNMLAEFKPDQLKPVLDRLSKMGVKVQEERNTSEDEGTHFREDRGLQYSKTDTKDVKNSRIIPEDVDKTVSSQIEKKFDDEINRLFTHVTPNIRRWANAAIDLYSKDQTLNSWEVDENKNATLSEGLNTVIDDLTKKINEYETKYGIRKDANIGELVNSILRKINSEGSGSGRNSSDKGQQEGTGGEDKTLPGGGGERRALDVLNDYKALSIRRAAAERTKAYILARSKSLQETYGLKRDEPVSYETIDRIFNDYNSDPEVKELYDNIVNSLRSLGTEFYVGSIELARTKGYYKHSENFIKLNVDRLSAAGYTKQNLASTLCHEMLHPLTSDIIAMYQKGHTDKLSPSQIEAAKDAVDIYNELIKMQKDGKIGDYYGLENPREMITELASPEWRSALRKIPAAKKWYQKLINAICRMIGKDPKYNKLGEMERTLTKLLDNFGKEQFDFASQNENELFGREPQGSKVSDPKEIKRLEEEPKIKVYRAMQVIDGKLYPPMAASVGGKLVEANELGQWIRADENPDLAIPDIDPKTGKQKVDKKTGELKWKFKLDKGGRDATGKKATDINAAYNPYWHMSRSPLNDQFKSAWIRPNIVVVECETPVSELTSGYKAERAKDAVGEVDWKSGSVSGEVFKQTGRARKVILSRWCKPVRVLDDAEVAQKAKEFIGDAKVEIPENVLTPKQRIAFEEAGFKIGAPEKGVKKSEQIMEALEKGLTIDNTVFSDDGTKFRTDHGDGNYPASSVESHVEKVAQKTGGKVKMVSSVDEITNKAARAAIEDGRKITGWYDEKTGEVHLYMPNIHDRYTAEKTIWHEVVGHKGVRELFGEDRFDKFLRDVWYDLDKPENAALKKLVDEERKYNPLNIYDAIEEGIARLAEDGKGEPGFWNGIKNKVSDFLHEIGYRIAPNTKDVKYLLWLSKNLQKNQNDPYWKMRAEAVKYRLDHERVPVVVAHDGMFYGNDGKDRNMENLTKAEWNEATDGQIHFHTTPSAATALDRYHRSLDEHGYMFTESYMDSMLSLKKLMNAIVPDKKIEDIASSENPYMLQNTMQGAMSDAAQMFERNLMKPLDKAMAGVLDAFDGKKDDEKIRNFNLYMITKHGLERNRVFFVRDFLKKMRRDEKKKQDADFLENSYYSDKEYLDNELKAGNIDLKEYYRQLDESIRNHFEADFEAGEHDYSGMHAIQEVAKSSDPYDDAEAIQSVMDSEAKMEGIKKGSVKDYWDKVKAATQYSIDSDYKNNIIDKESHDYVSNMFNWYVPLRKYDEATAEDVYGYITEVGDPKSYIGSTIMRARGHKYLSETNVLAQIGAMGNRAIKNGGMNAIKMAFARFARNNSNNNLITEVSVWYEKDPMTGIVYERYPDIPEDATADEINQIVSDFNKDMKAKALQNLATKFYRRGNIGYKFQRAENKSQHIVEVKIAGRTHAFIINGNPRAAQALNGLLEHKNDSLAGRVTAKISRAMAQLCTSFNPEFVMRNMIKDFEFASTNLLATEGLVYTKRFEQYYAKVGLIEGIRNSKLKDFGDTGGFGLFAKYRNGTLDTSDRVQKYFKEFMENGGETGWVQIMNMKDWTDRYKMHIKGERNKAQKVGKGFYDAIFKNLENVNEIAENLARFATYCASRDSNRSVIRSVYDAKKVSTNFNRHGSGNAIYSFKNGEMGTGKTARRNIYGFSAAWFRNGSMFFNAGIQSTNLLIKNFKNNKAGTIGYIASAPFISGMAMALLNNFIISNEDEKYRKGVKDPYAELPDYIRRNNLCVYIGGGEFVTIPLAIEERAFYGLGDFAAGMTFSKNISSQKMPNLTENKDIDKYLNPFMDAVGCMSQLVPVADYLGNSSFGKHPAQETIKALAPSPTAPFLEWVYNSDWKGAPIQRDDKYDENQPSWMLAYRGTPEWLINMNKKANAWSNDVAAGNEDMKGNDFLDAVTNPSALHHFYGSYLGGAATFVERVGGLVKNGKDTETKDIPFLRSLLYTPSEQSSLQRTKSKWYNYKDEMEKMIANVDRLKSKNVPIEKRISNYSDYYRFQNSKDAAKVRVIELAEKQMKQWKKLRDKSSDTESINFANQNIDRIMMEAVDDLDKLN